MNKEFVERLKSDLSSFGIDVLLDGQEIKVGGARLEKLGEAVDAADGGRESTKPCDDTGADDRNHPKPHVVLAEIYNRVGMAILNIDVPDENERFAMRETQRLYSLRLHTDAQASLAYELNYPVYEAHKRELRDINKRIKELKKSSIKEETYRQACEFFRKSARRGDPEGMWNLGWRYFLGEGVERSHDEAIRWFLKASELGHLQSTELISRI